MSERTLRERVETVIEADRHARKIPGWDGLQHDWEGFIVGDEQPRHERWECATCGAVIGPMVHHRARAAVERLKGGCTG